MKMKKQTILLALTVALFAFGCEKNTVEEEIIVPSNVVEVNSDITASTTWTADKIYLMKNIIHVTSGATLTIEPGTLIKGDKATKSCLVISKGGKISAIGTAEKPIVFTSNQPVNARAAGDWGGVILLGKAPVNQGTDIAIEGIPNDASGNGTYGGSDPTDNSGTMKYVRIEFAGVPLSPDNEINGLTLGGVGSGTTIDYIEVYRSGDDGFEFFGGTVTAKHLLSIGSLDDDFDTDFGFSGKIQFGLAQRYISIADVSGSNGFESDNDANGSVKAPKTSAIFSNMTIIGPMNAATASANQNSNYQHAAQIRRNSSISILNSVFVGYPEGIYIDDSKVAVAKSTSANYLANDLVLQNNIIYGCNLKSNEVKGENKADFETALRAGNTFDAAKFGAELLSDPFKYSPDVIGSSTGKQGTPIFTVKSGSVAETGAVFTNAKVATDGFFEKVAYRGAFGVTDWSAGWANFNPEVMAYENPGAVK